MNRQRAFLYDTTISNHLSSGCSSWGQHAKMDFSISLTVLEPAGMKKILEDPQVALVDGKMEVLKRI